MLGKDIIGIIEEINLLFINSENRQEKVLEYIISIKGSRAEAFIILIKSLGYNSEQADLTTKTNEYWVNTDLTDEFEEICFYDDLFKELGDPLPLD